MGILIVNCICQLKKCTTLSPKKKYFRVLRVFAVKRRFNGTPDRTELTGVK